MKRRDEVTVGILLTVAVIVLITGTLWLVRGGLSRGYPLHARFAWGHSLKQGQAVVLAGVTVGYVQKVELADGFIDVDMTIRNQYHIPKSAIAEVYPIGIFGDVIVAMRTGTPTKDVFAAGDTVPSKAASSSGLDALQAKADTIANNLLAITRSLEQELVAAGTIRQFREAVSGVKTMVTQINATVAEQNKNVTATLADVRGAVDSADIGKTAAQVRSTAAHADTLMTRLSTITTQTQAILARLERGEGTAGKLMADSTLYFDARRILASADSLMVDIRKNPRKYFNFSIW
jgi:phospholipid/cholesterol/gamma-HCH transport system substrate-binding protein